MGTLCQLVPTSVYIISEANLEVQLTQTLPDAY